jgi:hypothetical protein
MCRRKHPHGGGVGGGWTLTRGSTGYAQPNLAVEPTPPASAHASLPLVVRLIAGVSWLMTVYWRQGNQS